jgi:hypothetical protein
MALWLIPVNNDDKGGLYNETQESLIEWMGFGFSVIGAIAPPLPSPLYMMMKTLAVSQGRTMSAMMIAEDYLDGDYEFGIALDKMSAVAEDAIDDTSILEAPDFFSVVEGFGYEDLDVYNIPPEIMSFERCPSRYWKQGNNVQCQREKGHRGNHEY